jgi:hypothetical protein
VSSPSHPGLIVRSAAPEVSAFSYNLAKPICGVGNGSGFIALKESYLANGEVWFQVYFNTVDKGVGTSKGVGPCTLENARGWMVAKSKGRWLVTVLERSIDPIRCHPSRRRAVEKGDAGEPKGGLRSEFGPQGTLLTA